MTYVYRGMRVLFYLNIQDEPWRRHMNAQGSGQGDFQHEALGSCQHFNVLVPAAEGYHLIMPNTAWA